MRGPIFPNRHWIAGPLTEKSPNKRWKPRPRRGSPWGQHRRCGPHLSGYLQNHTAGCPGGSLCDPAGSWCLTSKKKPRKTETCATTVSTTATWRWSFQAHETNIRTKSCTELSSRWALPSAISQWITRISQMKTKGIKEKETSQKKVNSF